MTPSLEESGKAAEAAWMDGYLRGPIRTRWTELPLQVEDPAPKMTLLDSSGAEFDLASAWRSGPALVIFWRHYGCSCGVDRAARLSHEYATYQEAGAQVVIVGQGEPRRAAAYADKYHLPKIPILCDPELACYARFGLVEGKPSQVLFDAPEPLQELDQAAGQALAESRREQGRPLVDNAWILPGEFVIDQHGVVRLAYRYNYCEDFPDYRVLTAAIREARMAV